MEWKKHQLKYFQQRVMISGLSNVNNTSWYESWPLLLVPSNPPPPLVSEAADWYWWAVVTLVVLFSSQPSFVVYLTPAECLENDCEEKMQKKPRAFHSIPANLSWKEALLRCIRLWLFPFQETSKGCLRRIFRRPASGTLCVAGRPSGTSTCTRRCRGNTCWFLVAFEQKLPKVLKKYNC